MSNITKYCNLPPFCIAAGHDKTTKSFYAITSPHKKTIKVENNLETFKLINCDNCKFYRSTEEVKEEVVKAGLFPAPAKLISYCENNNICNASATLIESCMAGHILSDCINIEVNLPHLLWVWAYGATGKNVWKIYAVEEIYKDSIKIKPYLLANVYDNPVGAICWKQKGGTTKLPQDLQQAYYTYFGAPFNKETSPPGILNLAEYILNYNVFEDTRSQYIELNTDALDVWYTNPTYKTLMYTNDPKVINNFSPKVHRNQPELFAAMTPTETSTYTLVDCNGYKSIKIGKLKGNSKCKVLYKLPNYVSVTEEHIQVELIEEPEVIVNKELEEEFKEYIATSNLDEVLYQ